MTGRFEVLEHTADIGLRVRGESPEEVFAAAGEGLATLLGAWFPGQGEERRVQIEAGDREGLLVAWLDELLYLHEIEDSVFCAFDVIRAGDEDLTARVRLAPRGERELEGIGIKAATYHRLVVRPDPDGPWTAEVYLDV